MTTNQKPDAEGQSANLDAIAQAIHGWPEGHRGTYSPGDLAGMVADLRAAKAELFAENAGLVKTNAEQAERIAELERGITEWEESSKDWAPALERANERIATLESQHAAIDNFIPDADHVNALPPKLRSYIQHLETDCDPAGTIREAVCQRENAEALAKRCRELESQHAADVDAKTGERKGGG